MDEMNDEIFEISRFSVLTPLANKRLISICGEFPSHDNLAHEYEPFEKLLWLLISLDQKEKGKPITLVIDSSGGAADAFDALLDHINLISSPVHTVARHADSVAALLFICGAKGHRYIFEHTKILLHNVSYACQCPAEDAIRLHEEKERILAITNREYARLIDLRTDGRILNRLGNWANEHDKEKRARGVMRILDYEPIFTAQEALQYGLADHIITPRELRALFYEPT